MYHLTQDQCQSVSEKEGRLLFRYCKENGIHFLVTGSSGGLDSAVTLALAAIACRLAKAEGYQLVSIGVILPCESTPDAERLGREAIRAFGAREFKTDLTGVYRSEAFQFDVCASREQVYSLLSEVGLNPAADSWSSREKIANGNLKARLRMMRLYEIAGTLGSGMVLSTDNLSEYWMGFWTLHGDVGDYSPIQYLLKGSELYDLARYLGVPQEIIDARPDDGLGVTNGGDEAQLGASYRTVDQIIGYLIKCSFDPNGSRAQGERFLDFAVPGVPQEAVVSIVNRCLRTAYKRRGPRIITRAELGLLEIEDLPLGALLDQDLAK